MTDPLEELLVVQGYDIVATQLRTRRQNLPERAEAAEVAAATGAITERLTVVDAERHRLDTDATCLDDQVGSLRAKSAHADAAMYSGTITNPRELQSLQDEVASLARRVATLEDAELELMVAREPLDAEAEALAAERAGLVERAEALATRITVAEAEIDAELEREGAARAQAAEAVPAEMLAEYESLRSKRAGIGIARLEHGTCGGCHMKLSAVELDRIKALPADARITCEDCGRLLVR